MSWHLSVHFRTIQLFQDLLFKPLLLPIKLFQTKLGMGEFAVASPLGFEPSLLHSDRQQRTSPLPQAFLPGLVLKVLIGVVGRAPNGL